MLDYDPIASLQHYPITGGMRRFGLNPWSEPLYRVVFSKSRRYLVVGEWPDGSNCARWVVKHKNVGPKWIMEKWVPGEYFCSKSEWDRDRLILGPFPSRGDYELCHVFDFPPCDTNIEKWIKLIEERRSLAEITTFHRNEDAADRKKNRLTVEDMIRNTLPAFGGRCFAGSHGRRPTPTPIMRSAEELGLPTTPGMRTRGNPPHLVTA